MVETYLDRLKEMAYECFSREPETPYKRIKEAVTFVALAAFSFSL